MSYCKFENTLRDMQDCFETMQDDSFDPDGLSSEYERRAYYNFLELCREVADFAKSVEIPE